MRHYLKDLRATLLKGGARVRQLLHADMGRSPLHRAGVITTGKGLLDGAAFVVAGARNHLQANGSLAFRFEVTA